MNLEMTLEGAKAIAHTWALAQQLPEGWYVALTREWIGCWSFAIRQRVQEHDSVLTLMLLLVDEDGSVKVTADRRKHVVKLSPIGFVRETRLFNVMKLRTASTPDWYIKCERSTYGLDKRGIDGFAKISTPGGNIKLPFQIKSSMLSVTRFFEEYPEYRGIVAAVFVNDDSSDDELRSAVYAALEEMRDVIVRGERTLAEFKQQITDRLRSRTR